MSDRKCSGFPEKEKPCGKPATANALRLAVCEEHAKQAEAIGVHVVRFVEKKP